MLWKETMGGDITKRIKTRSKHPSKCTSFNCLVFCHWINLFKQSHEKLNASTDILQRCTTLMCCGNKIGQWNAVKCKTTILHKIVVMISCLELHF